MTAQIFQFQDFKFRLIHSQAEMDAYLASFPKDTIFHMRINCDQKIFRIRVKKLGGQHGSAAKS